MRLSLCPGLYLATMCNKRINTLFCDLSLIVAIVKLSLLFADAYSGNFLRARDLPPFSMNLYYQHLLVRSIELGFQNSKIKLIKQA